MTEPPSPLCPVCSEPATRALERTESRHTLQSAEGSLYHLVQSGVRVAEYVCAAGHLWQTRWSVVA